MANKEHLAILKQGVDAWNNWRKQDPDVMPDLDGAPLFGASGGSKSEQDGSGGSRPQWGRSSRG